MDGAWKFDAEHVHVGQDGLGDFDWTIKMLIQPVSLLIMATNSEIGVDSDDEETMFQKSKGNCFNSEK
ncbi:hypothetical protein Tco_1156307 [Tanacetum coccineum]